MTERARKQHPMPDQWPSDRFPYAGPDLRRLRAAMRRVTKARRFPTNTCPASRHLHMIAVALAKRQPYWMLLEEPQHVAETMLSVLESLWTLRTKHPPTAAEKARALAAADRAFKKAEAKRAE